MPSNGLGAYTVKIHQLIFGGLFVLLVAVAVKAMMGGDLQNIRVLGATFIILGMVFVLDTYYWVLCPLIISTGISIPSLPFDASEIGCISLICVYFIRNAMHREHRIEYNAKTLIAFPIMTWVCMIWLLNPSGLAIFGGEDIGARFYEKMVLGFVSLLVFSSLRLTEKNCRILFLGLCFTETYSFVYDIVFHEVSALDTEYIGGLEEASSKYYLLGALSLYTLMFARFRTGLVLRSLSKMSLAILFAVLVVVSGKRRGFASIALIPVLRSLLSGKDRLVSAVCIIVLGIWVSIAVAGHGSAWEIPKSAQRSLSVIVPKFAADNGEGLKDTFRKEVHRYAKDIVVQHPWVGRRGFTMSRDQTSWMLARQANGMENLSGHAYAGNWHGTWWAFSADFGIPAAILFGLYFLFAVVMSIKTIRLSPEGSFRMACAMYYGITLVLGLLFSQTSGHSALSMMGVSLSYGTVLAIRNGRLDELSVNRI